MIHDLCFNQDYTCLSVSTSEKHRIFNCDPFGEFHALPTSTFPADKHCTRLLRMLYSTSLTIIVSENENENGRVLKILNLKQNLKICELPFPSRILEVKLNRKRLIVFLEVGKIYIYDLTSIRLIKILEVEPFITSSSDKSETRVNADLSPDDRSFLVVPLSMISESTDLLDFETANVGSESQKTSLVDVEGLGEQSSNISSGPGLNLFIEPTHDNLRTKGSSTQFSTIKEIKKDSGGWVLVYDTITLKPRLIYKAHHSNIAKIAISSDSEHIATASTKGTIIRVSHIDDPCTEQQKLSIIKVTNLRRGHNPVRINALAFNSDSSLLGCGSESGTAHLFSLKKHSEDISGKGNLEDENELNQSCNEDIPDPQKSGRLSSSEDLNDNLANLLLSKPSEDFPKPKEKEQNGSYFSALKSSSKLFNNPYTKSIMKRLPYKRYLKTLIWEKPRRSFAYAKLPEADVGGFTHKRFEIGFASPETLMLASYNSEKLYQFQIPGGDADEREKCKLVVSKSIM